MTDANTHRHTDARTHTHSGKTIKFISLLSIYYIFVFFLPKMLIILSCNIFNLIYLKFKFLDDSPKCILQTYTFKFIKIAF